MCLSRHLTVWHCGRCRWGCYGLTIQRSKIWTASIISGPLGRPRRRWENNIKMDLQEVGGGCGDWMELAQDRDRWRALVSTVRNLRVPKMRGISWLAAEPVGFSKRTLLHGVSKYNFWFPSSSVPGSLPASTAANVVETSTVDYFLLTI